MIRDPTLERAVHERVAGVPGLEGPHVYIWVSNLWEPYVSSREAIEAMVKDVASMGFDGVVLDSKSCEDMYLYAEKGEVSKYVNALLMTIEACTRNGIGYQHLALWGGGDNCAWYGMALREYEPRMPPGSRVQGKDGREYPWYNYRSEVTRDVLTRHLVNLLTAFKKGSHSRWVVDGKEVLPIVSAWEVGAYDFMDSSFEPDSKFIGSYDGNTKQGFGDWLSRKYGTTGKLNDFYSSHYAGFSDARIPETILEAHETELEVSRRQWYDWVAFNSDSMADFFEHLYRKVKEKVPNAFFAPLLHQHGMVFTTGFRGKIGWLGLNPFQLAHHVDAVMDLPYPYDAHGRLDTRALSLSCEVMSCAARLAGKPYIGGLGVENVSNNVSFEMLVGIPALRGCQSLFCYDYNGEDDPGDLSQQTSEYKMTLKSALDWYRTIFPHTRGGPKPAEVAMLFPYYSYLTEPLYEPDYDTRERLLWWFKLIVANKFAVEFIDINSIREGLLTQRVLVLPAASGFRDIYPENPVADELHDFLGNGGFILASTDSVLAAFGLQENDRNVFVLKVLADQMGIREDQMLNRRLLSTLSRAGLRPIVRTGATEDTTAKWQAPGPGESVGSSVDLLARREKEGAMIEVKDFGDSIFVINHSASLWEGLFEIDGGRKVAGVISLSGATYARNRFSIKGRTCALLELDRGNL